MTKSIQPESASGSLLPRSVTGGLSLQELNSDAVGRDETLVDRHQRARLIGFGAQPHRACPAAQSAAVPFASSRLAGRRLVSTVANNFPRFSRSARKGL